MSVHWIRDDTCSTKLVMHVIISYPSRIIVLLPAKRKEKMQKTTIKKIEALTKCNLFCLHHLFSRSGSVFQFEGMINQVQSPTNTSPSRQSSTSGQSNALYY